MNPAKSSSLLLALVAFAPVLAADKITQIDVNELASGQVQVIGKLGVPLGQVVRVTASVVPAEKFLPDSMIFRERYLLSIKTVNGRITRDLVISFQAHKYAVADLFEGRIELQGHLKSLLKRAPTDQEIGKAESDLFSRGERTFLVFETLVMNGMPALPPEEAITYWSDEPFGPNSSVRVIKELGTGRDTVTR